MEGSAAGRKVDQEDGVDRMMKFALVGERWWGWWPRTYFAFEGSFPAPSGGQSSGSAARWGECLGIALRGFWLEGMQQHQQSKADPGSRVSGWWCSPRAGAVMQARSAASANRRGVGSDAKC